MPRDSSGDVEDHLKSRDTSRERVWYPSSNDWGIPDLLPELCYSGELCNTIYTYRAGRNHESVCGIVTMFIHDYKFEVAWNYPSRSVNSLKSRQWAAVCEPNFSLWADAPKAENVHNAYRTRWCARNWQEHGISVIPVLNWSTPDSYEYAWLGIPRGVRYAAVETQSCSREYEAWSVGLASALDYVRPETLIVYGKLKKGQVVNYNHVVYTGFKTMKRQS